MKSDNIALDVVEPARTIPVYRYHTMFPVAKTLVGTNYESNRVEIWILRRWDTIGCVKGGRGKNANLMYMCTGQFKFLGLPKCI